MDDDYVSSNPKTLTQSTSNSRSANVRTKVKSWMTGFVSEMRRKSPVSIQRWVDSIPTATIPQASEADPLYDFPDKDSVADIVEIDYLENFVNEPEIKEQEVEEAAKHEQEYCKAESQEIKDTGNPLSFQKLLYKASFLNKFSRENSKLVKNDSAEKVADDSKTSGVSFTSLGKTKINEFYDKLNINKTHYNIIKTRRMEAKNLMEKNKELFGELSQPKTDDQNNANIKVKVAFEKVPEGSNEPDKEVFSLENQDIVATETNDDYQCHKLERTETVNDSGTDQNFHFLFEDSFHVNANPGKRLGIGEIGRSVSANAGTNSKRKGLVDIGRCYSERHDVVDDDEDDDDDEEEDELIVNERNNSFPNAYKVDGSFITLKSDNSINNLRAKSVPVSPIPRSQRHDRALSQSVSGSGKQKRHSLLRDSSVQSDSSRCSSVESLLEARKPDAENILINLGFGPMQSEDVLSKIPKRFLKPSQVRGIDTEAFLKQQQLAHHLHEHSVLGYRGLVGNPHIPPSLIVAKIMERFQVNEQNRYLDLLNGNLKRPSSAPPTPTDQ